MAALDSYASGLAAVYSTRRLLAAHSGPLIRVRRSSDSAELDVGASPGSAALDSAALLAFAGSGSAFVTTFYDQTGGASATAPTTGAQPPIVVSGVLQTMGPDAIPAPLFNGTTHHLRCDHLAAGATGTAATAATLVAVGTGTGNRTAFGYGRSSSDAPYLQFGGISATGQRWHASRRGDDNVTPSILPSDVQTPGGNVFTSLFDGAGRRNLLDAAPRDRFAYTYATATFDRATIGALTRATAVNYWAGSIAAAIAWTGSPALADAMAAHDSLASETGVYGVRPAPYEAAWSWFNSPSAIKTPGRTLVGGVSKAGDVRVGSWAGGAFEGFVDLHVAYQADDHDNPALVRLADGQILAAYSTHGGAGSNYRLSGADWRRWPNYAEYGTTTRAYACLEQLSAEPGSNGGAIHQFYRRSTTSGWGRIKSTDGGATWGAEATFLSYSTQRPYPRFWGDGAGRIDMAYGHAHPEALAVNSLYHVYYQGANWYRTDGTLVRSDADLVAGAPITPADGTLVYDSAATGKRSWIWDAWRDPTSGLPVLAFAVFESTTDHRYYVARWDGSAWQAAEVCAAGTYLYAAEPWYSGGIAIYDASTVYCSRQVSGQWEIWRYDWDGSAWNGTAITSGSASRNIRPVVPRVATAPGSRPGEVYYLSGTYTTFVTYDLQVARIEAASEPTASPARLAAMGPGSYGLCG